MTPSLSMVNELVQALGAAPEALAAMWLQGLTDSRPVWGVVESEEANRSSVQDAAHRVLLAEQQGVSPSQADLEHIARYVLDREEVRLALQVREGGAWALSRAAKLARRLLARNAQDDLVDDDPDSDGPHSDF